MITIRLTAPTGTTDWYAYYRGRTLASYVADAVQFVEKAAPDLGEYEASVDETKGTSLLLFSGATQPASWEDAEPGVEWDLTGELATAAATAAALDASKIQRSASPVTAGAPQQKHLENPDGDTLQTIYEVHDGDVT